MSTSAVTASGSGVKTTLMTLPAELIGKIINHLGQSSLAPACPWTPPCARHRHGGIELPHREPSDEAALYNLCLTSRRAYELAVPALYSVVTLLSGLPRRTASRKAIYLFLRTLIENPRLRPLVRHLSCTCYEVAERPPKRPRDHFTMNEIIGLLADIMINRPADFELLRCARLEVSLLDVHVSRLGSLDQRVLCAILLCTGRLESLFLGTLHVQPRVYWYSICANGIIASIGMALEAAWGRQLPPVLSQLRAVKLDDNIHPDNDNTWMGQDLHPSSSPNDILLSLPAMTREGIDRCLVELV